MTKPLVSGLQLPTYMTMRSIDPAKGEDVAVGIMLAVKAFIHLCWPTPSRAKP